MGGGKGAIDHYVTPVKAGRVIIEVGGHCEFFEVNPNNISLLRILYYIFFIRPLVE